MSKDIEKLRKALYDKAIGYKTEEVTEEYGVVDDNLVLLKKKRSIKAYPPDMSAISMILEKDGGEYDSMSDEELEQEKLRLLELLKRSNNETKRSKL